MHKICILGRSVGALAAAGALCYSDIEVVIVGPVVDFVQDYVINAVNVKQIADTHNVENIFVVSREFSTHTFEVSNFNSVIGLAKMLNSFSVSWWQKFKLANLYMWVISCDSSLYDNILWYDFCSGLCPELQLWFLNGLGILFNSNIDKLSAGAVMRATQQPIESIAVVNCDEIIKKLITRGVTFIDTDIVSIEHTDDMISKVMLADSTVVTADYFINALDISRAGKVIGDPYLLEMATATYKKIQCVLYLDKPLDVPAGTVIAFPDSPWFVIAAVKNSFYKHSPGPTNTLAISIGMPQKLGGNLLRASDCTKEQITAEVWAQICAGGRFNKITATDKTPAGNLHVVKSEVATVETFSNDIYTMANRPLVTSDYKNIFHGSDYVGDGMSNTETAVTNGMAAANCILHKLGLPATPVYMYDYGEISMCCINTTIVYIVIMLLLVVASAVLFIIYFAVY